MMSESGEDDLDDFTTGFDLIRAFRRRADTFDQLVDIEATTRRVEAKDEVTVAYRMLIGCVVAAANRILEGAAASGGLTPEVLLDRAQRATEDTWELHKLDVHLDESAPPEA